MTTDKTVSAAHLVEALYLALLRRRSDPDGFASMLNNPMASVPELVGAITGILKSAEFAARLPQVVSECGIPQRFINEVSQFGEVELLIRRWTNEAARHRIVVDAGANGRARSNSYDLLARFGWRGLLIEANPNLIGTIRSEFADLNMSLINCAVSDYTGSATLHLGVNDDVSSLEAELSKGWGELRGSVTVAVRRLGDILNEHAIPIDFDLLSLDIEGHDIRVLNDIVDHHGFRPRWVIVEASYDFATKSLFDLAFSAAVRADYEIVDQTRANLILGLKSRTVGGGSGP
jgi:FkbM family methyltransferase